MCKQLVLNLKKNLHFSMSYMGCLLNSQYPSPSCCILKMHTPVSITFSMHIPNVNNHKPY